MVYVLDEARRDELVAGAGRRPRGDRRASTWWPRATTARPWSAARRGELRFAPGGELERPRAAAAGASRASTRRWGSRSRDGRVPASLPRRARPALVGARVPARRATCWCRPSRATSSSTGAARTTSAAAATARCTAATREGVLLLCGRRRARARASGRSTDVTAAGPRPLRGTVDAMTEELDLVVTPGRTRFTCACAPACASRTTGSSSSSSARSAASGYVVNLSVFALCVEVLGPAPPGRGHGRLRRRGDQQLLVEPPLDLPRRRGPRRLPGRALLRGQRASRSCSRPACSSCS